MSRYHYYIESKSRMRILSKKGYEKDIKIKDVVKLTENGHKMNILANGKEDRVLNLLIYFAIAGLILIFILTIIGSDILGLENKLYNMASDMVAIIGLILTIVSFDCVKDKLDKYMKFGYVGNRWMILLFIFLIAIYASSPLPHFELENKFANIISLLCFFISFYNFYNS